MLIYLHTATCTHVWNHEQAAALLFPGWSRCLWDDPDLTSSFRQEVAIMMCNGTHDVKQTEMQGHRQSPPGACAEAEKEDTVNGLLTLQQANTYFSNIQKTPHFVMNNS